MTANNSFFPPDRASGMEASSTPPATRQPAQPGAAISAGAGRWWQAGVYCSAPALFLWIVARLPDDMLAQVFRGGASMPAVLNQLGDALFFCGWVISAILLWGQRRRPGRDAH